MTPEEQQALAAAALQNYGQTPVPAMPPLSTPGQTWADAGQAALAAPPPPPMDTQALGQAALGAPGLSPVDQQALGQAALAGYGGAPPPAQQWTDPNQPGPGAVTDAQLLAATPAPTQAAAALPPSAMAANPAPDEGMPAPAAPSPEAMAAVPPAAQAAVTAPAREGWAPTQLTPEEEAQFKQDMVTKPGYKDWYEAAKKDWGEAPDFDDPRADYDYRGAWKAGVVPAIYKHDGKYHWSSSLDNGQMLKAPDHPTAWMEYFMRATGKDPNDVGVKNEHEAVEYIGKNPPQAQPAPRVEEPAPTTFKESLQQYKRRTDEEAAAATAEFATKAAGKDQEAALYGKQAKETGETEDSHKKRVLAQYERANRVFDEFQAANDKAEAAANTEHKETTRQRVGGMLMLLGGMLGDGLARLGGNNSTQYMQQMQSALDKDIALDVAKQRERYNNDKEAAKRKGDEYAIARQMLGDTPEADKFTSILAANRYASEIQKQTAQSASEVVRAAGATAAAKTRADGAQKTAELLERSRHIAQPGGRGSPVDIRIDIADAIRRRDAKLPITQREAQVLSTVEGGVRADAAVQTKAEAAQAKLDAAAAVERAEFIPGLKRRPGMVPLSPKTVDRIQKDYDSALGVDFMAKKVAGYWNTVMDETLPNEVRYKARNQFMAEKQRLLSGDSVDTGQGTITASDAKRMGGAWPELPANVSDIPWYLENEWKGLAPSADTYLEYGANAMEQRRSQLADAYGMIPSAEADELWAEHDEMHPPKQPKPKGESAPPKKEGEPQAKPARKPTPTGMVDMIRLSDGHHGFMTPAQAEAANPKEYKRAE